MTYLRLLALGLCLALVGCVTFNQQPKGMAFMREVNLDGIRLGASEKAFLRKFPQAKRQPFGRPDRRVYEVTLPNPHISLAVAYFVDGTLRKMEFRYFNGVGVSTLTGAGGWDGLKNYMISRFGPPSRVGSGILLQTEFGDLNAKYAKFSGEWDFPTINRMAQYIAMSDDKGGLGIVTLLDTTPSPAVVMPATTATPVSVTTGTGPETLPRPLPVGPPNPGF